MIFTLAISITSDINLPPSPVCLFSIYGVCCEEIRSGRTSINLSETAFDIIFRSIFNQEIGLQFFMNRLSLSFCFN